MSQHFQTALTDDLNRLEEQMRLQTSAAASDATLHAALGGSRMYVQFQTILVECMLQFGRPLGARLAAYEPEHSPFDLGDFDDAIAAMSEADTLARRIYADRVSRGSRFGGHPLSLDEERFSRTVNEAANDLRTQQAAFSSKRSKLKRIGVWLAQKIGEHMVVAVIGAIGALALAWFAWL